MIGALPPRVGPDLTPRGRSRYLFAARHERGPFWVPFLERQQPLNDTKHTGPVRHLMSVLDGHDPADGSQTMQDGSPPGTPGPGPPDGGAGGPGGHGHDDGHRRSRRRRRGRRWRRGREQGGQSPAGQGGAPHGAPHGTPHGAGGGATHPARAQGPAQAPAGAPFEASGVLEVAQDGGGFLRHPLRNYRPSTDDVYVPRDLLAP